MLSAWCKWYVEEMTLLAPYVFSCLTASDYRADTSLRVDTGTGVCLHSQSDTWEQLQCVGYWLLSGSLSPSLTLSLLSRSGHLFVYTVLLKVVLIHRLSIWLFVLWCISRKYGTPVTCLTHVLLTITAFVNERDHFFWFLLFVFII